MADYKPYGLKGLFQIEISQSYLQKPTNLTTTFFQNDGPLIVNLSGYDSSSLGIPSLKFNQSIKLVGLLSQSFGAPNLLNKNKFVLPNGFLASNFNNPNIKNVTDQLFPASINVSNYGNPTIYNSRQYLRVFGTNTNLFGSTYLQGGVKYVKPIGFNSSALTNPKVVNTKVSVR